MRLLRATLGLLLAVLFAVFAIANRQTVSLVWSPVNPPLEAPLYILALGTLAVGFILGALMSWLDLLPTRFTKNREIRKLKKELQGKQQKAVIQDNWTALPPSLTE